jgi:RHS repeat-associated protein
VPQDVQAVVEGETTPRSSYSVSVKELTNLAKYGRNAMPGTLPPQSAFTYAAMLSVEGAESKDVTFPNGTPIVYVDNFLDFPKGEVVPAGRYDRKTGQWVAEANGVVLQITGSVGDEVTVDPIPAGMTSAERKALKTRNYPIGKSLWRVATNHFSAWDFNWAFAPPDDADPPPGPPPIPPDNWESRCGEGGSIIECETQVLREEVRVAATPFKLVYSSARQPGSSKQLRIPVTGGAIPGPVKRVQLDINVAGKLYSPPVPPTANQVHTLEWDGLDTVGRRLVGRQQVDVAIGFVYDASYQRTARFGDSGSGIPITASLSRAEVTLWRSWSGFLSNMDAAYAGLGGWTLDIHHVLDPWVGTVYLGDGTQASTRPWSVNTVAGTGVSGPVGNDGPAISATISPEPYSGVVLTPAGTIYFADTGRHSVRKVDTAGIISAVATGACTASAPLCYPRRLALGPDGLLYVVTNHSDGSRLVTIDLRTGTIAHVFPEISFPRDLAFAPDGTLYVSRSSGYFYRVRDGMVTQIGLGERTSQALAVGPDGSVYIGDHLGLVVWKYGTNGIFSRFAGGAACPDDGTYGDGKLATEACLSGALSLDVGSDGSIYIADAHHHLIRRVDPSGVISRVVGTSSKVGAEIALEGSSPGATIINQPTGLKVAPDGTLYFIDSIARRLRRMSRGNSPGSSVSRVGSSDGQQIYSFDVNGKHLATQDSYTGATIYSFGYTSTGFLDHVLAHASNRKLLIQRNAAGTAIGIQAPDGQVTALTIDSNNDLTGITHPGGTGSYTFEYYPDRMLKKMWDPKGNAEGGLPYEFAYDKGRLISDKDPRPLAVAQTLTQTSSSSGWTVTHKTPKQYTKVMKTEITDVARTLTVTHRDQTTAVETSTINGTGVFLAPASAPVSSRRSYDTQVVQSDGSKVYTRNFSPASSASSAHVAGAIAYPSSGSNKATFSSERLIELPSGASWFEENTSTVSTNSAGIITAETTRTASNGNGHPVQTTFDPTLRRFTTTTGAGRISYRILDTQGRTSQVQTTGFAPSNYEYDSLGRLFKTRRGSGVLERLSQFDYFAEGSGDRAGYLQTLTEKLVTSGTAARVVSFDRDAIGRVLKETIGTFETTKSWDANGNLATVTPPSKPLHFLAWDAINLQKSYNPPPAGVSTPSTSYTSNVPERSPLLETRPGGATLRWAYDTAGRQDTLTVPNGLLDYDYYPTTPPPGGAAGALSWLKGPYDVNLGFEYDGPLVTNVKWSDRVTGKPIGNIAWTYNGEFLPATESITGASVTFGTVNFGYDYDKLLTCASLAACPAPGIQPGAEALSIVRDAQKGGVVNTVGLGNVTESFTYNTFGEVSSQVVKYGTSTLMSIVYDSAAKPRDALGRITQRIENFGSTSISRDYIYAATGALTDVKIGNSIEEHFRYESNGNRLSDLVNDATNATYDDQDRMVGYAGWTYVYGSNGELQSRSSGTQSWLYSYDVLGNLLSVKPPASTLISYRIDGKNRRIARLKNGVLLKQWLYKDDLSPLAELDAAGAVTARFVYGTRTRVPDFILRASGSSTKTYRLISDQLGSPRMAIDIADGTVVYRADYSAFGKQTMIIGQADWIPFGFAGGLYDPETLLVRFGARDYDAVIGRWTSKDPILFNGGQANLYVYTANDPMNAGDPRGTGPVGCLAMATACGVLSVYDVYDFKSDFDDCMKKAKEAERKSDACGTSPRDIKQRHRNLADVGFECVSGTFNDHLLLEGVNAAACLGAALLCFGQPV